MFKKLLNDFSENRRCWILEHQALDRSCLRTSSGKCKRPVPRETVVWTDIFEANIAWLCKLDAYKLPGKSYSFTFPDGNLSNYA